MPPSVAADCSTDVTNDIMAWIADVPDGSTLKFGANACYKIEGTLCLSNRNGLIFDPKFGSCRI